MAKTTMRRVQIVGAACERSTRLLLHLLLFLLRSFYLDLELCRGVERRDLAAAVVHKQ